MHEVHIKQGDFCLADKEKEKLFFHSWLPNPIQTHMPQGCSGSYRDLESTRGIK